MAKPESAQVPEEELAIAKQIQRYMLPKKLPTIEGYDLGAFYYPCSVIGGDYYDVIEIDEDRLGILVADVSGKGLPGAMVMVQTRTLMRAETKTTLSPRDAMVAMNRGLAGEIPKGMFVTMFYVLLNLQRSDITVCCAGHNPMIFWHHSRQDSSLIKPEGIPLGIDKGPRFDQSIREVKIPLEPGDRFLIYTDGLTEAMNDKEEEFGLERAAAKLRHARAFPSSQFVAMITASLDRFRGSAPQSDDITLVTLRRLGEAAPTPTPARIVDGEKFVSCTFCDAVNPRSARQCAICKEMLDPVGEVTLAMASDEIECACGGLLKLDAEWRACSKCGRVALRCACGNAVRIAPETRACSNCSREICASCRRKMASAGNLCAGCAEKRKS